jgi:hypothetical protein
MKRLEAIALDNGSLKSLCLWANWWVVQAQDAKTCVFIMLNPDRTELQETTSSLMFGW